MAGILGGKGYQRIMAVPFSADPVRVNYGRTNFGDLQYRGNAFDGTAAPLTRKSGGTRRYSAVPGFKWYGEYTFYAPGMLQPRAVLILPR